jgi:uncharacterized membrane protein YkvI
MTERAHRVLVLLEAIFLLLPTLVYWCFFTITSFELTRHLQGASRPDLGPGWLLLAFSGAALMACLRIAFAYLIGARDALRRLDRVWWGICGGGVALTVLGTVIAATPFERLFLQIRPAIYGLPALLVFLHLYRLRVLNQLAG